MSTFVEEVQQLYLKQSEYKNILSKEGRSTHGTMKKLQEHLTAMQNFKTDHCCQLSQLYVIL